MRDGDRPPWRLLLAAVTLLSANTCDDIARVVVRNSEQVTTAARLEDVLTRSLAGVDAAAADAAAARLASTVDDTALRTRVEEATKLMTWDVTCEVIAGDVPGSPEDVAGWVVDHAAEFGLEVAGDLPAVVGDAVLDTLDSNGESQTAEACKNIQKSGL